MRKKYKGAIDDLVDHLEVISGLDLVHNDFADDGIGIGVDDDKNTYASIGQVISVIAEKGTFAEDDLFLFM